MTENRRLIMGARETLYRKESQKELVKGFTLIGIIPIIMSCVVYVTYEVMSILL